MTTFADFDAYQDFARSTAIYPQSWGLVYTALGLTNEAGEVAGKIKKSIRDGADDDELRRALMAEVGDVLWYAAMLCHEAGIPFAEVARQNVEKLTDRRARGVIGGSGDRR